MLNRHLELIGALVDKALKAPVDAALSEALDRSSKQQMKELEGAIRGDGMD